MPCITFSGQHVNLINMMWILTSEAAVKELAAFSATSSDLTGYLSHGLVLSSSAQ